MLTNPGQRAGLGLAAGAGLIVVGFALQLAAFVKEGGNPGPGGAVSHGTPSWARVCIDLGWGSYLLGLATIALWCVVKLRERRQQRYDRQKHRQ